MRILICIAAALFAVPALAQKSSMYARNGYEAFPNVWYLGGDATQPKRLTGMLVLTDSTFAFHPCVWGRCADDLKGKDPFKPKAFIRMPLSAVKAILASSHDETISITYETANGVEVPKFEGWGGQAAALDAKIRYRLKKLGVTVP